MKTSILRWCVRVGGEKFHPVRTAAVRHQFVRGIQRGAEAMQAGSHTYYFHWSPRDDEGDKKIISERFEPTERGAEREKGEIRILPITDTYVFFFHLEQNINQNQQIHA